LLRRNEENWRRRTEIHRIRCKCHSFERHFLFIYFFFSLVASAAELTFAFPTESSEEQNSISSNPKHIVQ
jgi:hypothetical protein